MKYLTALLITALSTLARADLGTPRNAVEATIRQAQHGQIVGVDFEALQSRPKHAWTEASLLQLLAGIDPDRLTFQAMDKEKNLYWFPMGERRSLVRLIEPRRLDFEVMFIEDKTVGCKGYYRITGVNP